MGRWTPDEHGCIYDETGCFARLTPNKAERLASRHNADIDALTAERDELQRRLDAVLECVTYTDLEWRTRERSQLSWAYVDVKSELKRRITAIAEGREG